MGCAAAVLLLLVGCGGRPAPTAGAGDSLAAVGGAGAGLPDGGSGAGQSSGSLDAVSGAGEGFGAADSGQDVGGGAGAPGAVADAAAGSADEAPGSGAGTVSAGRAAVLDDGAGPTDAGDLSDGGGSGRGGAGRAGEPGMDAAGPEDGSLPSSAEAADETAADETGEVVDEAAAAADLPGPLSIQYEPGGSFFEFGFREWPDRYDLDVFSDEVAVRTDSVLVDGAVVRGLVQNMSERLFARHVTVSVGDSAWVFPLAVQPGEVAPFVIEGYRGPSDPEQIGFDVSAQLVPEPDPRRSFYLTGMPGIWADTWDQIGYLLHEYPHITRPEGVSGDDDWVQAYETAIELREPPSHPSIADEVTGLVVEDLRVYLTTTDDEGRVLDVSEMTPYDWLIADDGSFTPVPVRRADRNTRNLHVVFLPDYGMKFGITVGGAHDGAG